MMCGEPRALMPRDKRLAKRRRHARSGWAPIGGCDLGRERAADPNRANMAYARQGSQHPPIGAHFERVSRKPPSHPGAIERACASRSAALRDPRGSAVTSAVPSRERLPRDFFLVTAANLAFFLNFASFFLLPVHLHELGVSERTIGRIMGTAGFAGIVVLPFLGVLLDRVDRRRFVVAGGAVMAAASFAYVLVPGASPALYLLRSIQGFAFTASFVTASTLAA